MAAHNERAATPRKIAFDFISETTLRRNQSARKLPPESPLAHTFVHERTPPRQAEQSRERERAGKSWKDEGGRMKDEVTAIPPSPHPSAFILHLSNVPLAERSRLCTASSQGLLFTR
jgi:hypothetical protein